MFLIFFSGKLEYEYQKMKQKDEIGSNPERSREVKSFEPTAAPPSDDEELDGIFGIECDVEIVNENAEEDDEYWFPQIHKKAKYFTNPRKNKIFVYKIGKLQPSWFLSKLPSAHDNSFLE